MKDRRGAISRASASAASANAVWLMHHRQALADTWHDLAANFLSSALVALTLGVALALPGGLWIAVHEAGKLAKHWGGQPHINLFTRAGADTQMTDDLLQRLGDHPQIASVLWQSPQDSLVQLMQASDPDESIAGLTEDNPLPGLLVVTPHAPDPDTMGQLADELKTLPGVEAVQVDLEWILRLQAIISFLQRLVLSLGILLAGSVLLLVTHCTRIALEARREEVTVLHLIGASDVFVRRPFLYLGTIQGMAGGLLAWLMVLGILLLVAAPVQQLVTSYGSVYQPQPGLWELACALIPGGAALGWCGARIAMSGRLAAINLL